MLRVIEYNDEKQIYYLEYMVIRASKTSVEIDLDFIESMEPEQSSALLTFALEKIMDCRLKKKDETSLYGEYIAMLYNYCRYYSLNNEKIKLLRKGIEDTVLNRYYHYYSDRINLEELVERR